MSIIDISVPLFEGMHAWPGSVGFRREWVKRIGQTSSSNDSIIKCDAHIGTHVDAPLHFVEGGASAEALDLDALCGPVVVADLTGADEIGEKELDGLGLSEGVERLLFKTRNSDIWAEAGFNTGFVGLTEQGALWCAGRGLRLVGSDYLSVAPYSNGAPAHRALLGAGVVLLEGLNLSTVMPGRYELICLPLKIVGSEGAPARAILRAIDKEGA